MIIELEPNEKIVLSLRRHWFVLSSLIFGLAPVFVLPFIVWFVLSAIINTSNPLFSGFFWLASSLLWLFLWAGLSIAWVNNYLDFWVVTNQRIISVYQKNLFKRETSELSLSRIQDSTVSVKGMLQTFINYGNLEIRTAGTLETDQQEDKVTVFIFQDIPRPYEVQNILSKIHYDFVKGVSN